jgi:putative membrane protein
MSDADSRIRTHLANERTFLAWLRTGLSLIVVGLGAAQFVERDLVPGLPVTTVFAALLVVAGSALTVLAGAQYRRSRDEIDHGTYRAASATVGLAVAVVGIGGLLTLALVFLLRRAGP